MRSYLPLVGCLFGFVSVGEVHAFPLNLGQQASDLVGWPDFDTGYSEGTPSYLFGADLAADNRFFVTADVEFDSANDRMFVADFHNHRVLIFDLSAGISANMSASNVLGQQDFVTGGANNSSSPYLYNDNTPNGVDCLEGVNACGMSGARSVAYDSATNRLFASDANNNRILVWNLNSISDGMAADFVIGQQDFVTGTANTPCAGGGLACSLSAPATLAIDSTGRRLFVADSGNSRVLSFDLDSVATGMAASGVVGQATTSAVVSSSSCLGVANSVDACSLNAPDSVAIDEAGGRLFVADGPSARVLVFDISGGLSGLMTAIEVIGQVGFTTTDVNLSCDGSSSSEGVANECGFNQLYLNLVYNSTDQELYVADGANHRVLAFDVTFGAIDKTAFGIVGQPSFTDAYQPSQTAFGGGTSSTRLINPMGVAYDPDLDRVFVCDSINHRIVSFGSNVGGVPVEVEGDVVTVSTEEDPDTGETTVTVTNSDDDTFQITFPEGTTGSGDNIDIVVGTIEVGPLGFPTVNISANLPEGTTKTVSMTRGSLVKICIYDHAVGFTVTSGQTCTDHGVNHSHFMPDDGECVDQVVDGDLGDGDDPLDPDGLHTVQICAQDGIISVSGLKHTQITGVPAAAVVEDSRGPHHPHPSEKSETEDLAAPGGCQSGGSGSSWAAVLVFLGLALRRRR